MRSILVVFAVALLITAVLSAYAERGGAQIADAPRKPAAAVLPTASVPQESPLASLLERVPNIEVQTIVGQLPQLPHLIPAVYRQKAKGPEVRVVWPSPKDNSQILKPGTYTVTGKIPGTQFQPKAFVTVKISPTALSIPTRTVDIRYNCK
jgi:hypothetical protein